MGHAVEAIKGTPEKQQPLNEVIRNAEHAGQAMLSEVQKDWKSGCSWMKSHPREDAAIAAGALIIVGAAISLKDSRDGAAAIAEGNKMLQGEQIVAETSTLGKLGSESSIVTKIKFGNSSEERFWVDPQSAQGRRMLDKGDGLGGFLKK